MVKYSKAAEPTTTCKARGSDLRVHFKARADLASAAAPSRRRQRKRMAAAAPGARRLPAP
jgi:hypothetical protein